MKGKTPPAAQAPMIEIDGKNKWKTIIQNIPLNKYSEPDSYPHNFTEPNFGWFI